jgi:hypothetical protein
VRATAFTSQFGAIECLPKRKPYKFIATIIGIIINAGEGKNKRNIKAFEKIIGVERDGVISEEDVFVANGFEHPEEIVNPYVRYRLHYYRTRKDADDNPGWFKRAKSFMMKEPPKKVENDDEMVVEDYIVLPK